VPAQAGIVNRRRSRPDKFPHGSDGAIFVPDDGGDADLSERWHALFLVGLFQKRIHAFNHALGHAGGLER
jgi:hypothetical protein